MEGNKQGREGKNKGEALISLSNLCRDFVLFSAAFLFIGLIAAAIFLQSTPLPSWEFGEESPTLNKTANLSFESGQSYVYKLEFANKSRSIFLNTKYVEGCQGIALEDSQNSYILCLRKSGFYSNSTSYLGDTSFVFYSPWMLYLHENFSWKLNRTITFYPTNITQKSALLFEVKNTTKIYGRDAYVVQASKLSSAPFFADDFVANSTYFVDVQNRILLGAQSQDARIILISAPFELDSAPSELEK